jgi:methyl-accepting chemotaxis protein
MTEGEGPERAPWLEAFDEGRQKVLTRIQHARKISDAGVLEAGDAINTIVKSARAFIKSTDDAWTVEEEGAIERLVEQVRTSVTGQFSRVQQALEHSSDIKKAGAAIEGAAKASRLLALNARVEASRLTGTDAAAFDVIAEEVRDLSEEIAQANRRIDDLIGQLLTMLPEISAQAEEAKSLVDKLNREQRARHDALCTRMRKSTESGTATLNEVLEAARTALSGLQFQDPMIQDVEGIDRILLALRSELESRLEDPTAAVPAEAEASDLPPDTRPAPSAPGLEAEDAGELLLF